MTKILETIVKGLIFTAAAQGVLAQNGGIRYPMVDKLYKDKPQTGKCHGLLPAVVFNNFDPQAIQNVITACPNVQRAFSPFKLTPLHLAVIAGNHRAIAPLLQAGASSNAQDFAGYSPVHHAAMKGDVLALQTLLPTANPTLRTNSSGTYMDFLRFNAPFRKEPFPLDPSLFSTPINESYEIDPTCLGEGVSLVHENVATPQRLIEFWAETNPSQDQLRPRYPNLLYETTKKFEKFKKNPSKLAIRPILKDDADQLVKLKKLVCGVVALQKFKKGDVIGEYMGEFVSPLQAQFLQDKTYLWDENPRVDAKKYRSIAAMINDGFPNASIGGLGCMVSQINPFIKFQYGIDGLPQRKIVYALETISPGEEIVINYGFRDPIKQNDHVQLRPKALRNFFQNLSWKKTIKKLKELETDDRSKSQMKSANLFEKAFYPFATPSTFRWLVQQGLMTEKHLRYLKKIEIDESYPDSIRNVLKESQIFQSFFVKEEL